MPARRHSFRYLLDTDTISDLIRNPDGTVAKRIAREGAESVCINVVIAGEIRFGAAKRNSVRLTRQVEAILAACEVLPLESPLEADYADIRLVLERQGNLIGPNDLWIAAHARSAGLALVTNNVREFSRVPRLKVENWLEPGAPAERAGKS